MAQKTFHIGEYVVGGSIQVDVINCKKQIWVRHLKFKTTTEVKLELFISDSYGVRSEILNYLNQNGSSYWADQVMKWVESQTKLGHEAW